jgi:hypothetical protein
MGVLTDLFGDRSSEKFGDSWLETYFTRYDSSVKRQPYVSPVMHLADMWIGHFSLKRKENAKWLTNEAFKVATSRHACLRPPACGLALALFMLSIEQPQVTAAHKKYEQKYRELMTEVMRLEAAQDFDSLNKLLNLMASG